MSRGINKVILVGHVGQDPEMRYTQGGMAIATLSLATTSARKDKDGNVVENTQWHRVKLFGKVAEIAGEYVKKGGHLYIEGRIEYGSYEKDGVTHYTSDIIGEDMQMLGRAEGNGQRTQQPSRTSQRPAAQPRQQQTARVPAPAYDDFADDDIPF